MIVIFFQLETKSWQFPLHSRRQSLRRSLLIFMYQFFIHSYMTTIFHTVLYSPLLPLAYLVFIINQETKIHATQLLGNWSRSKLNVFRVERNSNKNISITQPNWIDKSESPDTKSLLLAKVNISLHLCKFQTGFMC